jgi:hypothetical protein
MISQYSTVASGILLGVVLQKLEGYKQNRKKQDTARINKIIIPTMEHAGLHRTSLCLCEHFPSILLIVNLEL